MGRNLLIIANPFPPSGPMGWSMRIRNAQGKALKKLSANKFCGNMLD